MKLLYSLAVALLLVLSFSTSGEAACKFIPFCKECPLIGNTPICTECYPPLWVLAGGDINYPCKSCSFMDGCLLCYNTTICYVCRDVATHGPDLNGFGSCSKCAPNCKLCKWAGGGKCDQCQEGFYLDPASRTCLPGPPSCLQAASTNTCLHCMTGFWKKSSDSTCAQNPPNCSVASNGTCTQCNPGRSLVNGLCAGTSS